MWLKDHRCVCGKGGLRGRFSYCHELSFSEMHGSVQTETSYLEREEFGQVGKNIASL